MKVLLSWLREFAPIDADPAAVADTLSDLGLAVEDMTRMGHGLDGIVVARVLATKPHPAADRIQLVDVDLGDGEALQICCGAFNMTAGDLVPLATLGTVMPGGLEIARRKLRGEWSNGMLCSSTELELGVDAAGIMILDPTLAPGTAIRDALGIEADVLYDLEVNPNRPDAMSVAGVARDLAARLRLPFAIPEPTPVESGAAAGDRASVEIAAPDLCGRFVARVLDGISVGVSPLPIQNRLRALGMRPINSVVDISNYVMLELGQPNHTYDLDRVSGRRLRVRMADHGETVETLDGVVRTLTAADGVIADGADTAIGIAGVMGGASTEISERTTSVLFEAAWWHPMTVAASSRRLGLRSEASARFERGSDPGICELAARRFAELLAESGATLAPGVVDVRGKEPVRPRVRLRSERTNALLGTDLSVDDISGHLVAIGCDVAPAGDDLDVVIPSYRPDSTTEIDLIEEVARLHGYSRIARTVPRPDQVGALTAHQIDRRALRQALVGLGLDEVLPVPFLAPGDLSRAGLSDESGVRVANPLVAEESVMRTSLRPGLLKTLAYNGSHRATGISIFEVGHVYAHPAVERVGQRLPDEREMVGAALAGAEAPDAVRVWAALADALGVPGWELEADAGHPGWHATRTAGISVPNAPADLGETSPAGDGRVVVGVVGELDPAVLAAYDVSERVAFLEVDLDVLLALPHGVRSYVPVSKYPSSDLDLAFDTADAVPAAAVERRLRSAAGDLLAGLRLFDVYRGAQVADGRRSLAYSLRLQAPDRTLTDDEVAQVLSGCVAAVEGDLDARLRS